MPASPADSSLAGAKPPPRWASRWSSGGTVVLVLLFWIMPSLMSWKLTLLAGLALVAYAGYLARQEHAWLKSARIVPGTVVELIQVSGAKGRPSYRPRIRYTTPDGAIHDFIRTYASSPAGVDMGESLAVAYHDATPQDLRILTFGQRFGFAVFVAVLGICLILLGTAFQLGRHYVPSLYLSGHPLSNLGLGR